MHRALVEAGYAPLREYVEERMVVRIMTEPERRQAERNRRRHLQPAALLGSVDINTAYRLEKYGRLCELEPGRFTNPGGYVTSPAESVRKLAALGVCRIDPIGDAVFVRPLAPAESAIERYRRRMK